MFEWLEQCFIAFNNEFMLTGWAVRMVCESHRDRCVKAVGVDISPRMIWKAQNLWAVPQQASFIASNLLEYAVPEDTGFDIVFSFAVIYYIIPMEKLKEKIREWVKPGSLFHRSHSLTCEIGGLFVAGTDYYQENPRCHGWSSMMDIDMDLRPAEQWKKLFEETFQLKNVTQLVLDYPDMSDDEKGTLFTMGYV